MTRTVSALAGLILSAACMAALAQKSVDYLETSKAWGMVVADFDGDGHDDLFVTGHDSDDRIWYWTPAGYLPAAWSLPWVDRHACASADVDRDGRLDFFCAVGGEQGYATDKANELWMQRADGTFARAPSFGAEDPTGRSRRPIFLDLDHDGWPDLYLTNDATVRADGASNWNHLYLNHRDNTFVEVRTIASGSAATAPEPGFQCVAKGDIDGDGWDDLLVCYDGGPGHLYVNNHQNDFTEVSSPAYGKGWRDARLVDMNGDGRDDLVVVTTNNHVQVWLNTGAAPWYVTPSLDALLPHLGAAITTGDFNGDGLRAIYVVLAGTCNQANDFAAPDVLYTQAAGGTWTQQPLKQSFGGCGSLAGTADGVKVLLANGTPTLRGPSYLLDFGK